MNEVEPNDKEPIDGQEEINNIGNDNEVSTSFLNFIISEINNSHPFYFFSCKPKYKGMRRKW